jgi:hypothetical protein
MNYFNKFYNSTYALLLGVLICEIIGGALMFALFYLQFAISEYDPQVLKAWAIACGIGIIFFSVIATRILRIRAKKLGADIII